MSRSAGSQPVEVPALHDAKFKRLGVLPGAVEVGRAAWASRPSDPAAILGPAIPRRFAIEAVAVAWPSGLATAMLAMEAMEASPQLTKDRPASWTSIGPQGPLEDMLFSSH